MKIERTSFTLAALAGLANALQVNLGHDANTFYQNQDQCDALSNSWKYHYEFDQDSCRCFFCFDVEYDPNCHGATPHFNPLHIPGHEGDLCISTVAYNAILVNDLGMDCLAGTEDDPHANNDPEIVHVSNPDQCEVGTTFDASACACFESEQCEINCAEKYPEAPFQNPLEVCECIPQSSLASIFNHGLNSLCQVPEEETDEDNDDEEDDDEE